MKGDKVFLILIIGMVLIVIFNTISKSMDKKRVIDLASQEEANRTLLQQQKYASASSEDSKGLIGDIGSKLPLVGGLF